MMTNTVPAVARKNDKLNYWPFFSRNAHQFPTYLFFQRNNYVIKWLDDQADGNAKEDEEDVDADADEALASGAELLRRSGIVLGDQILDEEAEKEEEENVAELQSPYRERVCSIFFKKL